MKQTIYTIGYSGFSVESFLATLKKNLINVVIDVRSAPYSEFFQQYNKDVISGILKMNHIHYRNYAREFGARQANPAFQSADGYLDFETFARSPQFHEGVKKIAESAEQGFVVTFMCSEKNPINCHRAILVARAFHEMGYPIVHLLPDDKTETQEELEQELLDLYYPDRDQISLFQPAAESDESRINEAYKKQNNKIGYKMTESEIA